MVLYFNIENGYPADIFKGEDFQVSLVSSIDHLAPRQSRGWPPLRESFFWVGSEGPDIIPALVQFPPTAISRTSLSDINKIHYDQILSYTCVYTDTMLIHAVGGN